MGNSTSKHYTFSGGFAQQHMRAFHGDPIVVLGEAFRDEQSLEAIKQAAAGVDRGAIVGLFTVYEIGVDNFKGWAYIFFISGQLGAKRVGTNSLPPQQAVIFFVF